jgi:putative adenylate-forming enzyme
MTWKPLLTTLAATWPAPRTRDALEHARASRADAHVAWVRQHSRWYAERLGAGHWRDAPLVTVAEWRSAFDTLNTAGLSREQAAAAAEGGALPHGLAAGWSSGTMGEPGLFVVSRAERAAWALRAVRAALPGVGRHGRERVVMWLRAPSALYHAVRSPLVSLDYFGLESPVETLLPALDARRPTCLVAPASTLRALVDAGAHTRGWPVRRVVAVAEGLAPLDAQVVGEAFGVTVGALYQATEGFLGATCAHGRMHLHDDLLDISFEWVNQQQRRARPVVTDLARCTQPVCRLRLDDVLHVGDGVCPCGAVTTWLHGIEGRARDIWHLAGDDGVLRTVWPRALHSAMAQVPGLAQYQLVQEGPAAVRVALDPGAGTDTRDAAVQRVLRLATEAGASRPAVRVVPFTHDRRVKLRRVMRTWEAA